MFVCRVIHLWHWFIFVEKNPLNLIKQLQTEEVEVVKSGFDLGEEDTRGIKHCGGQYAKVLPTVKEPVTSGENDPIQVLYHSK